MKKIIGVSLSIFWVSTLFSQLNVDCLAEYNLHGNLYRTTSDHIENVTFLNQYYILFPYDFVGTPNNIN